MAFSAIAGPVFQQGDTKVGIDPQKIDFTQGDGNVLKNMETYKDMTISGTYHAHPSGESRPGYVFAQPPSE
ncbi:hypothetical protein [Paraflavitalea speifideaquila]|uniref:hypothetical protein n=1 Tax=Paraflavitalea speifideaquila TaxID=3076558 RepID=UPI0028EE351B|nr:hypothetical protein [Paraflavitalea speifideiaquila]